MKHPVSFRSLDAPSRGRLRRSPGALSSGALLNHYSGIGNRLTEIDGNSWFAGLDDNPDFALGAMLTPIADIAGRPFLPIFRIFPNLTLDTSNSLRDSTTVHP